MVCAVDCPDGAGHGLDYQKKPLSGAGNLAYQTRCGCLSFVLCIKYLFISGLRENTIKFSPNSIGKKPCLNQLKSANVSVGALRAGCHGLDGRDCQKTGQIVIAQLMNLNFFQINVMSWPVYSTAMGYLRKKCTRPHKAAVARCGEQRAWRCLPGGNFAVRHARAIAAHRVARQHDVSQMTGKRSAFGMSFTPGVVSVPAGMTQYRAVSGSLRSMNSCVSAWPATRQ